MAQIIYKNKEAKRLRSVTTIINQNLGWNKNTLLNWYAREFKAGRDPTEKKEKAASIGTLCHHYITCDFYNEPINEQFKSQFDIEAILLADRALKEVKEYLKNNNLEIVDGGNELSLVSEQYQYGGTIDVRLLKNKKTVVLGDFKTSTSIYEDHLIQVGAYDHLLIENGYAEPEEYLFIHISKDPKKEDSQIVKGIPIEKEIIKIGFEIFQELLKLDSLKNKLNYKPIKE